MTAIQFLLLVHGWSCYSPGSKIVCRQDTSWQLKATREALHKVEHDTNARENVTTRLTAFRGLVYRFCLFSEYMRLVGLR